MGFPFGREDLKQRAFAWGWLEANPHAIKNRGLLCQSLNITIEQTHLTAFGYDLNSVPQGRFVDSAMIKPYDGFWISQQPAIKVLRKYADSNQVQFLVALINEIFDYQITIEDAYYRISSLPMSELIDSSVYKALVVDVRRCAIVVAK